MCQVFAAAVRSTSQAWAAWAQRITQTNSPSASDWNVGKNTAWPRFPVFPVALFGQVESGEADGQRRDQSSEGIRAGDRTRPGSGRVIAQHEDTQFH